MFKVRQPLYNVEDGGDWFEELVETPVDDEQPDTDSETDTEEDGEISEDEAEPTGDEVDEEGDSAGESSTLGDDTEIDLGEGRQPVKLGELKQGYLRQSDYTKKTQALAEERKTFEAERAQIAPVKQMSDFLGQNPFLREQIQMFIQEFTHTGRISIEDALADAQYGQYINTLMAQNQALQRELSEARGKYGELEFTGTMKDLSAQLKADYGDLATDDYLKALEDRAKNEKLSPTVLKEIAEAHLAKQKLAQTQQKAKKAAKEAEKQTYQKMREKADTLPANPKKKGQVPNSSVRDDPHAPIGWDEIF